MEYLDVKKKIKNFFDVNNLLIVNPDTINFSFTSNNKKFNNLFYQVFKCSVCHLFFHKKDIYNNEYICRCCAHAEYLKNKELVEI